jgi:hypothetical protein
MDFQTIPIILDRERQLQLTLKGMIEFQKVTGKSLWELTEESFKDFTEEEFGKLLWACLLWEDPALTVDQVLLMVRPAEFPAAVGKVIECLALAFPQARAGANGPPLPRRPGSTCGPSAATISNWLRRIFGRSRPANSRH